MSDFETVPVGTMERLVQVAAERDTLAAHVVELRDALEDLVIINEEDEDNVRLARAALEKEPTTSLAHLKARWQAEAARVTELEKDAARYRWLVRQAWFQSAFDRFDPDDGGIQERFESEADRIIDVAMQDEDEHMTADIDAVQNQLCTRIKGLAEIESGEYRRQAKGDET